MPPQTQPIAILMQCCLTSEGPLAVRWSMICGIMRRLSRNTSGYIKSISDIFRLILCRVTLSWLTLDESHEAENKDVLSPTGFWRALKLRVGCSADTILAAHDPA